MEHCAHTGLLRAVLRSYCFSRYKDSAVTVPDHLAPPPVYWIGVMDESYRGFYSHICGRREFAHGIRVGVKLPRPEV